MTQTPHYSETYFNIAEERPEHLVVFTFALIYSRYLLISRQYGVVYWLVYPH